jgi:putative endopeptidase
VNGAFTVGENIGDLGGLSIALLAYQLSLKGEPAPVIDGLTGEQRVFFGWAQVWRTKSRDAEAIRRLAVDPHSPPEFRCNGVVRNMDAFYEAFDVDGDDALFLEPQRRVRIWNCSPVSPRRPGRTAGWPARRSRTPQAERAAATTAARTGTTPPAHRRR